MMPFRNMLSNKSSEYVYYWKQFCISREHRVDDMGRQCNSINCEEQGICVFFEVYHMIISEKYSFTATHENALWGVRETKPPLAFLHSCYTLLLCILDLVRGTAGVPLSTVKVCRAVCLFCCCSGLVSLSITVGQQMA